MKTVSTDEKIEYAILVGVSFNNKEDINFSMDELQRLCETANVQIVGKITQKVKEITSATLIGSGKLEEIKAKVLENNANLVIFNNELSGSQMRNIAEVVNVKTIDRTDLILDIFAKRAVTNEGKLQVELAQLKYNLPRLSGVAGNCGRFGSGGVGMRGPGETKVEIDRRVIKDNILKLEKEIENIKKMRGLRRKQRRDSKVKMVTIVGYTNAGKSTLLNSLTKSSIYADDKLFATLDTTSRKIWIDSDKQFVLTDTVGFIDKLPPSFETAFASTLEEVLDSNLIIHLIDIADKNMQLHKDVVNKVLQDIGAQNIPRIVVYNKIDSIKSPYELKENEIPISAKNNINLDLLKEKIMSLLWI